MEDQPRLFRQFVQFNRNALQGGGGSGLGLWICKNLATFHGGRMVQYLLSLLAAFIPTPFLFLVAQGFHSEGVGRGSTFFVDLPIFSAEDPAAVSGPAMEALSFNEQQLLWPSPAPAALSDPGAATPVGLGLGLGGAADAASPSPAPSPSSPLLQEAAAPRRRTKILIVDDSAMNRCVHV